jgi:hypothetical protein
MKTKQFDILDTYQDFLDYWSSASSVTTDEQIQLWQTSYMKKYPELLEKQVQCYKTENMDWQDVARKVFPTFPVRLRLMRKARDNILESYQSVCTQASEKLGIDFNIILVVYVGIGCGAGWATKYDGQPAILLGLENIAEENWHTKTRLRRLISHEIGHLIHMKWRSEREEAFEDKENDPLFLLYSEGFAQRCEHLINEKETWLMAPDKEWLHWCIQNKSWLAGEFLSRLSLHTPVKDFFGSWFDIQGKKQTGYFLGHAFVCELEKAYSLREIALLRVEEIRKLSLQYLNSTSTNRSHRARSFP